MEHTGTVVLYLSTTVKGTVEFLFKIKTPKCVKLWLYPIIPIQLHYKKKMQWPLIS